LRLDKHEQMLIDDMARFFDDPLSFVLYAFPWGEKGTALEDAELEDWQRATLVEIGDGVKSGSETVKMSTVSGHGTGKSALMSMLILWFVSTRPNAQIVVTANTATQLQTKTWRELKIWHDMCITHDWFTWTATKFYENEHPGTWYAAAIPWSKDNPDAFQGTHSKHVMVLMDESSGIPYVITEVVAGAMTTKGAIWLMFGNGVHASGPFFDTHNSMKHRWITRSIDSRDCRRTNKQEIANEIDDYGIDSDRVKRRWLGQFPSTSSTQFISTDLVKKAATSARHDSSVYRDMPMILGVDVARFGDDRSTICARQGLVVHEIQSFRELDTMAFADKVALAIDSWEADAIMIDVIGIGAGVVDRLRQMGYIIIEVNAGTVAGDQDKYFNKRAEMWDLTEQWLRSGGQIPRVKDGGDRVYKDLMHELCVPKYTHTEKGSKLQIEKKDTMKSRGENSPDVAESLIHTFAVPIAAGFRRDRDEEYVDDRGQASSVTGY